MNYKIGEIIYLPACGRFAKIKSIRSNGSIQTLWIEHKKQEYSIKCVKGSNTFNTRNFLGANESQVIKVKSMINYLGMFLIFLLSLYFF